jgi:GTP diphosphokinase / guanosine-3',5'-bis(diphosphate) 3'-diphosphatase
LLDEAKRYASRHHAGHFRPNAAREPVASHLAEVSRLVADAGAPEHVVAAAWLHDVVEDTEATLDDLRAAFGHRVADIVEGLTDPEGFATMPLAERKRRQAERVAHLPDDVKLVKLADQVSNMKSVVEDPPVDWDAGDCLAYLSGAAAVAAACGGVSSRLDELTAHYGARGHARYGHTHAAGPTVAEVVAQLDMMSDEMTIFYDRVERVFIERFDAAVDGVDAEASELTDEELFEDERYVPLPSAFDIHEWRILRDFCRSRPEGALRERLLEAVHGRGAFRWTKAIIWEHELRDAWFAFRDEALAEVARSWAEEHDVPLSAAESNS